MDSILKYLIFFVIGYLFQRMFANGINGLKVGPSPICELSLESLCNASRNISVSECDGCIGANQESIQKVGCSASDVDKYCRNPCLNGSSVYNASCNKCYNSLVEEKCYNKEGDSCNDCANFMAKNKLVHCNSKMIHNYCANWGIDCPNFKNSSPSSDQIKKGFDYTNLKNCYFRGAKFGGATINGSYVNLSFKGANLRGANLSSVTHWGTPDKDNINFEDADLTNASLTDSVLGNTNQTKLIVTANFTNAKLINSDLSGTSSNISNFNSVNFTNANLTNAKINQVNFKNANFTNANLTSAVSNQHTDFDNANLSGAILDNADLQFVTNLDKAIKIITAKCNSNTKLPKGLKCNLTTKLVQIQSN